VARSRDSRNTEHRGGRSGPRESFVPPADLEIRQSSKVYSGRRKTSISRVRIFPGSGRIFVNGRLAGDYFTSALQEWLVFEPLRAVGVLDKVDVFVNAKGGGKSSQAGATRLGIAKALCELDESIAQVLRKAGYLARDSREKERRKYGLKKARKAPQYSKR
jgi:small subunit ribosomal protein S9